jgi:hypothetical protein
MRHDDGIVPVIVRAIDIGTEHNPVIHLDGYIPIDTHALTDLAFEQRIAGICDVVHGFSSPMRRPFYEAPRRHYSLMRRLETIRAVRISGPPD